MIHDNKLEQVLEPKPSKSRPKSRPKSRKVSPKPKTSIGEDRGALHVFRNKLKLHAYQEEQEPESYTLGGADQQPETQDEGGDLDLQFMQNKHTFDQLTTELETYPPAESIEIKFEVP